MKRNINYIATLLIGGLIGLASCTDNFEEQNTNELGDSKELQLIDYRYYTNPLGMAQQGIYFNYDWGGGKNWPFQIMQNLSTDMYSGYFHDFNGAFNDKNSTYNLNDGWTSSTWSNTYGYTMSQLQRSEDINEEYPSFMGITKIVKVATMHRISDIYGPIIYTKFGSKTGSDPDSQQEAYYAFFKDLDEGCQLIKAFMADNPGEETFANADILMPEDKRTYAQWLKFANSLRLRLAMRIANVDPAKAKAEAQKALAADAGGVLEEATDVVAVSTKKGYTNPLGEINKSWGEVFMNASMESFLVGYNDPRISKYFNIAVKKTDNTKDESGNYKYGTNIVDYYESYKGVRQGTGTTHNFYAGHSKSTVAQNTNAILFTAAEAWFLRAEAALRGYSSEDAGQLYANGVRASFDQWGVGGAESYLQSDNQPIDYRDAFDAKFDAPATTTITPKWEEAAGQEEKLEKIITQKWLACYPEGCEAWAEQRRTGYPKLFKVAVNNSQGTIDTDVMIRRIFFPQALKKDNPDQYNKLLNYLNGPDTGGTRLWWDVGQNIF